MNLVCFTQVTVSYVGVFAPLKRGLAFKTDVDLRLDAGCILRVYTRGQKL
jgi:hypothetical protein